MATTLNHIVFDIKNTAWGGRQPDDAGISDRQVEYWIHQTRALLIHNELVNRNKISESFIQHLGCVELEEVDASTCCDDEVGCSILKSVKKIPTTIQRNGRNTIVAVQSIDQKAAFSETTFFRMKFNQFNKYTKNKARWFLKDNFLYLTGNLLIEKISVSGIFEDPGEVQNFSTCEGDPCFDPGTSEYPVTTSMASLIMSIVLKEKLGIARQMPPDTKNDAQESGTLQTQVQK
jgi:hypothetical protein